MFCFVVFLNPIQSELPDTLPHYNDHKWNFLESANQNVMVGFFMNSGSLRVGVVKRDLNLSRTKQTLTTVTRKE